MWLQVLLAFGMALYLALPEESAWFVGPAMVGALVCAAWSLRRRGYVLLVLLTLTALAVCLFGPRRIAARAWPVRLFRAKWDQFS